ncbi:hypothetical protein [Streptomyces sp. NPDC020681]|uniref:hypothetical protein n=1 Tax=Streptomyces sp. NPDC020681 TaxID=3365083 RepID=UPI00379D5252
MTRKRLLIALISTLALALALVVTDIATGFVTGGQTDTTAATGARQPSSPPVAPPLPTAEAAPGTQPPAAEIATPQPTEKARYVGISDDGRFAIAVVVWRSEAIAYVSNGTADEAWLSGVAGADRLVLSGDEGAVLDATVQNGTLSGTAAKGQWKTSFTLSKSEAPAGLYRASGTVDGNEVRFGLIVLPDQRQTGTQWVNGSPKPAPGWDLGDATVPYRGTELRVEPIEPGDV